MVGPFGLRPLGTMRARALPIAKALVARGHSVTMLLPPWQNPTDAGLRREEDGVLVDNIRLPPRVPGLFHLLTATKLARRVLAARPDVVHAFKPKAYSGLVHWLLAYLPLAHRPPVVVDSDDWEGPGGWNELRGYTTAQRGFFAWQERWGLTHADAVTVASRTLESLAWGLGVPSQRVFYVPNGVGYRKLRVLGERPDPPYAPHVILLYTRYVECPLPRIVEILVRVRERVPDARMLVVGEGRGDEAERLMDLGRQHGVARFITVAGWEPDDLASHFSRAALGIYPFEDTLVNRAKCPAKLLEMLAAGVPVVAEAVGEVREFVRHGETGWLVRPGDVDGFSAAVARLLLEPDLLTRMGREALRDARSRLAWERSVDNVESAYGMAGAGR